MSANHLLGRRQDQLPFEVAYKNMCLSAKLEVETSTEKKRKDVHSNFPTTSHTLQLQSFLLVCDHAAVCFGRVAQLLHGNFCEFVILSLEDDDRSPV